MHRTFKIENLIGTKLRQTCDKNDTNPSSKLLLWRARESLVAPQHGRAYKNYSLNEAPVSKHREIAQVTINNCESVFSRLCFRSAHALGIAEVESERKHMARNSRWCTARKLHCHGLVALASC